MKIENGYATFSIPASEVMESIEASGELLASFVENNLEIYMIGGEIFASCSHGTAEKTSTIVDIAKRYLGEDYDISIKALEDAIRIIEEKRDLDR